MFPSLAAMSNSTNSLSTEEAPASVSSDHFHAFLNPLSVNSPLHHNQHQPPQKIKKKRSLPGNPDPDAEVIALSPKTLLATNRFVCEICNKGFQRDQNLQLHRRGHNLPWKLKQRSNKEMMKKRAYVCPEPSCVHHHPSRALGDLTGIKKHFCRKHGEKKWKCDKCEKVYAVQSDWKAHSKTCGTREYRCDCGTLFSRKDSFITHRAFCDALAEESARISAASHLAISTATPPHHHTSSLFPAAFPNHLHHFSSPPPPTSLPSITTLSPFIWDPPSSLNPNNSINSTTTLNNHIKPEQQHQTFHHFALNNHPSLYQDVHVSTQPAGSSGGVPMSATALLQKAATIGPTAAGQRQSCSAGLAEFGGFTSGDIAAWQKTDSMTRDFLGLTSAGHGNGGINGSAAAVNVVKDMLTYGGELQQYHHNHEQRVNHALLKAHGFGLPETAAAASETWGDY